MQQWKVGILLFNEVEVLDFAGPFEVFSITDYPGGNIKPFEVRTVAQTNEIIRTRKKRPLHIGWILTGSKGSLTPLL